mmetsp:Transcript_4623/g.8855  ORF Transcript_4623/g.8855 Transcript_4623/m.8855 type:complete len:762 (+) Transcript_4623:30-2315(+)|eukprot:CAMPEP_0175141734 /NCGR_PEP_ID=MMETSP0087-20121206/12317_1 /TAXON_ID=136419 /ORGANISM="Unknown Unknown, Strain D1" /LENGTH=761 /DNA_ID=CAMNT_0016425277 /DNA_START=29 /DNA_END=2314 /DNA_ORIENTATION=+
MASGLVLGLAVVGGLFALLVVIFICLYSKSRSAELDVTAEQLDTLKKATSQFNVDFKELTLGKLLGKGSQGEVFAGTWRESEVAIKKIDTRLVSPDIIEEFCQEAEIMRRLRHPCLTLFMGVSLEHPNLCIVTEIVSRGSLFDIIGDKCCGFAWSKALSIATDIARGMTYLHAMEPTPILHRDLKSLNILVDQNWKAKIADFGMTRFAEEGTMTQCGSPLWMAPEMIKNEPYTDKADVYSFGIVLWELYTRQIPYRGTGLSPTQLVVKVVRDNLRPDIPEQCPKQYAKLMEKCWHPDPEGRPSFALVLKVLETFMKEPSLVNHVPMSEREINVPRPVEEEEDLSVDLSDGQYRIAFSSECEVLDKVVYKRAHVVKRKMMPVDQQLYNCNFRGKKVTLKKCMLSNVQQHEEAAWNILQACSNVRHPNIVIFMGAYKEQDHFGVVYEDISEGTLEGAILDKSILFEWDTLFSLLIGAAQGLAYLHGMDNPISHQDLTSARLLIDKNWRVKLADVGFVDLEAKIQNKLIRIPNCWLAPESLQGHPITPAANVYSFGLIIWEMLVRKPLFDGQPMDAKLAKKIVQDNYRPKLPENVAPGFKAMIKSCWAADPTKRPSINTVLEALKQYKALGPPKIKLVVGQNAKRYRKKQTVFAYKSKDPVIIRKDWGKTVGKPGSWIILSGEDDVYPCDPEVFAATYEPAGDVKCNEYRKVGFIVAKRLEESFAIVSGGSTEHGLAGDFLVQNDKGDQWFVAESKFLELYEEG